MIKLDFENFKFIEKKDSDIVRVIFYENFYFDIKKDDILNIGSYKIDPKHPKSIEIDANEKKMTRFYFLIDEGLTKNLWTIQGNKAIFLEANTGVPLIGNIAFGLTDRDTKVVEVRPMTSCNLNCIFCSVDEGTSSKKIDFVVDKDYVVSEFNKLVDMKACSVKAVINPQGEPLLYGPLVELVRDIRANDKVESVLIISNGTLLNEEKVDKLIDAGVDEFSLSIHSMSQEKNSKIIGKNYDIEKIKSISKYIKSKSGIKLIIAPVLMKNINLEDVKDVIVFAKSIGADLGVQNFLEYSGGRIADKQMSWSEFTKLLEGWEKELDVKLLLKELHQFKTEGCKKIPKPFKKGDVIDVDIICPDHDLKAMIGVAGERSITVYNSKKEKGRVKVKLLRDKDNIYSGKCL